MPKINFLNFSGLVFLLVIAFSSSCQKELNGDEALTPADSTATGECKDCVYFPMCEGATYTYEMNTYGTASDVTNTMNFGKDSVIDGKTYKLLAASSFGNDAYFNCDGNVLSLNMPAGATFGGTMVGGFKTIMFKANENVGAKWSTSFVNSMGQTILYSYTLAEKGILFTVLGKPYTDVIHVNLATSIEGIAAATSEYYYAKDIGFIYSTQEFYGETILEQSLKSYDIP